MSISWTVILCRTFSFGPAITKTIKSLTKLPLDVHLMLSKPRRFITSFVEAGAANITIHVECEDTIFTALHEIQDFDCKAGLCIKPKTPLSAVKEYMNRIDRLLIMTVEPGFGGQKFMTEMMAKVREAVELRHQNNYKFDIEVDGGLDNYTIWDAVRAGAEVIVAGTSVLGQQDATKANRRSPQECQGRAGLPEPASGRSRTELSLGIAGHQPEQVGEPVEIPDHEEIDFVGSGEFGDEPFRAAAGGAGRHRARQRRRWRPALAQPAKLTFSFSISATRSSRCCSMAGSSLGYLSFA